MSPNGLLDGEGLEPGLERTPTLIAVDSSGSMNSSVADSDGNEWARIAQVNSGLQLFKEEIEAMEEVKREVDVSMITFGGDVSVKNDFMPITDWEPPKLYGSGKTPMGDAIEKAIDLTRERKDAYKHENLPYKRPFIWVLTDGKPTDMEVGDEKWNRIQEKISSGEENKRFALFIMTVGENTDTETIRRLHPDRTVELKDGMFEEYFEFLSNSVQEVSGTAVGEEPDVDEAASDVEEIFTM
jgi:uncharacterized protein YegL